MTDPNCLFCKIAAGEIPSEKVYEDDETFAFLDIHPVNPGHTLVIPKEHFRNVLDIPKEKFSALMTRAKAIAEAIVQSSLGDGAFIAMNNEPAAGQIVFHAHVHVVPRLTNDGLKHWPGKEYIEKEAEEIAQKIKTSLA